MRDHGLAGNTGPTESGRGFARLSIAAVLLVSFVAFLGIGAPAASAAPEAELGWAYQRTFGSGDNTSYIFASSALVADTHGNVFVANHTSALANGYAPDGTFLGKYGFNGEVGNIAIDSSNDTVYVDHMFGGPISRFTSNGEPVPTYTLDPGFSVPAGASLAVDETTHDVLVTEPGAEAVLRYDTTGALIDTISTPSISPTWIATAADGSFYVAPEGGSDVIHLSAAGIVLGTISVGGALQGLAFDHTAELLVASVGGTLKTYTPIGTLLAETPGGSATTGLTARDSRLYELEGVINAYTFTTIPGAEAPVVSNIQANSAHVEAEVDPGAGPPEGSVAHFEYSSNGGESWAATPDQPLSGLETIEADLEGLLLNTTYLVRVRASNSLASKASAATPFSTLEVAPVVITGGASDRSETSAVLNGTINPAGLQTAYHFEYGTTTGYGSRVPLSSEAPVGNQRAPHSVSKYISGLQPGTTYHYRLVAENAIGESPGEDRTFTTLAASEAAPVRGYEQVTPVDKEGAQVLSKGQVQAAADGSAIVVATAAAPLNAESSPIAGNYLTRRGVTDWQNWQQVDAPLDGQGGWSLASTLAVSDDLEHAMVISNRVLAPGGISGQPNYYIHNLETDGYSFVGVGPDDPNDIPWKLSMVYGNRTFLAGAPDFSWIVFRSEVPLLPETSTSAFYRWSEADGLEIVSRIEGDVVIPFLPVAPIDQVIERTPFVSSDGSAVAYELSGFGVFRRANGVSKAVSVSHVPGDSTEPQGATLDGMTPDGRYVFFHSPAKLTEDATLGGPSLYRYDAQTDEMLYVGITNGSSRVVAGFSDNGDTVYFDAGQGQVKVWLNGQERLVSPESPMSGAGAGATSKDQMVAVSSNGRYYAWVSAYPDFNVKLYDAVADQVMCVSCPNGGGPADASMTVGNRRISNYMPRALLDDGTVFFDTPLRLVSGDHNGARDVYEYKEGRLTLISPGQSEKGAFFVDASKDGSDVFFQTDEGLVSQDTDGASDVYDARVGGGFASQNPPPPAPPCSGSDCRAPSSGAATVPSLSSMNEVLERARISLGKVTAGSKAVKVKVTVNQTGTIKVAGAGIKAVTKKVTAPGSYTLSPPLTRRARERLRTGKEVELSLKATLSAGSSSASANYSRTLGK